MSTPVESFVSACASPPSIESKYTCDSPPREERNATVFPSGDHTGEESCPLCVNCIAEPPVVGTIQMLLALRLASISAVATVYATHFPSGDTCGSAMRCNLIMSSKVMGCFAASCAETASPAPSTNAPKSSHRKIALFISILALRKSYPYRAGAALDSATILSRTSHAHEQRTFSPPFQQEFSYCLSRRRLL